MLSVCILQVEQVPWGLQSHSFAIRSNLISLCNSFCLLRCAGKVKLKDPFFILQCIISIYSRSSPHSVIDLVKKKTKKLLRYFKEFGNKGTGLLKDISPLIREAFAVLKPKGGESLLRYDCFLKCIAKNCLCWDNWICFEFADKVTPTNPG